MPEVVKGMGTWNKKSQIILWYGYKNSLRFEKAAITYLKEHENRFEVLRIIFKKNASLKSSLNILILEENLL